MCLSTAYTRKGEEEEKVAEYVSNITTQDGKVILTDILSNIIEISGRISKVDLVKNIIVIED